MVCIFFAVIVNTTGEIENFDKISIFIKKTLKLSKFQDQGYFGTISSRSVSLKSGLRINFQRRHLSRCATILSSLVRQSVLKFAKKISVKLTFHNEQN